MGGFGSGNHGGRATVEDGLVLDLNRLIRLRMFKPGETSSGSIVWIEVYSGRKTAYIGYKAYLGQERGWARLSYTVTDGRSGGETHYDYCVELTTTPQPFGGRRWWWVCPRQGDLVSKLYMPSAGGTFASRKAHRLTYRSQREGPIDRARERALTLRRRLGSREGFDSFIPKLKGMRSRTFRRKLAQVRAAEADCNDRILATLPPRPY
jgi:hypothetical protein